MDLKGLSEAGVDEALDFLRGSSGFSSEEQQRLYNSAKDPDLDDAGQVCGIQMFFRC